MPLNSISLHENKSKPIMDIKQPFEAVVYSNQQQLFENAQIKQTKSIKIIKQKHFDFPC